MKRPRIALCLLMAIFATSLYAVGFAADRDNAGGGYNADNWAAEEADLCEYAYEGYCEYAYDRPVAAYPYDGCTAGDAESLAIPEDDNCQVAPNNRDELEAACIDELEAACLGIEIDLGADEYADVAAPALDYESGYGDDYSDDLAENAEPQASDAGSWCGRYCLTRESAPWAAETLPAGAVRKLVERVSDSLVQLLSERSPSENFEAVWPIDAENAGLAAADDDSQSVLTPAAALGWLDGLGWSAANDALAAGTNRAVVVDPFALSASQVLLPFSNQPQPVNLRALARPLARLVVDLRSGWTQAWNEVSELAAEPDEVPEVSSRPEAPAASPPATRAATRGLPSGVTRGGSKSDPAGQAMRSNGANPPRLSLIPLSFPQETVPKPTDGGPWA